MSIINFFSSCFSFYTCAAEGVVNYLGAYSCVVNGNDKYRVSMCISAREVIYIHEPI